MNRYVLRLPEHLEQEIRSWGGVQPCSPSTLMTRVLKMALLEPLEWIHEADIDAPRRVRIGTTVYVEER